MNFSHPVAIANDSAGIIYIMDGLLAAALTVIIERSWFLRLAIRRGQALSHAVAGMRELSAAELDDLMIATRHSPHGAVINAARAYPELRDPVRLGEVLEEAIMWQAPLMDRRLWVLDTVITLAPLLGLLGTIIGLFIAILGLVFFNGLNASVRLVIHQMETLKIMLVIRLTKPPGGVQTGDAQAGDAQAGDAPRDERMPVRLSA